MTHGSHTRTHEEAILETILKNTGIVSSQELEKTITHRNTMAKQGKTQGIGEILVDQGALSSSRWDSIRRLENEIDGFSILEKIGEGKLSAVYKARQISMNRVVAIKVINPQWSKSQSGFGNYLKEVYALGKLNHPNIIQGISAGETDHFHYIVMEYCEGITLDKYIKGNGGMSEDEVLRIGVDLSSALLHLWEKGMVHRNITSENIMIAQGQVKLCDLGFVSMESSGHFQTTYSWSMASYAFMSPEQLKGEPLDFKSDVYSFGAVLYYAITGHYVIEKDESHFFPPYILVSGNQMGHSLPKVIPLSHYRPQISPKMEALVHKMLSENCENRCGRPREVDRELRHLLEGRERRRKKIHALTNWMLNHLEWMTLALVLWILWPILWPSLTNETGKPTVLAPVSLSSSQIYDRCAEAVVLIYCQDQIGAGVVLGHRGTKFVLTNAHVVKDALQIQVVLKDERSFKGEVIRSDKLEDMAVISIPEKMKEIPCLFLAEEECIVGDDVLVIGHPKGYRWSLTKGTVSAVRGGIIQTDAAINPGNSGGPVLNNQGKMIGLTTSVVGKSNAIGFAISVANINKFLLYLSDSRPPLFYH